MLLCSSAALGAEGQTPEPDPSATARVHLGWLAFTPAVVCSGGYDSNPYREVGASPTVEIYAIPQFKGWIGGESNRGAFWGAAEIVRFSDRVGATNWQVGGNFERAGPTIKPYVHYNFKNTNANPTGFEVGHKSMRIEADAVAGADVRTGGLTFRGSFESVNTNWAADAIYQSSSLRETLNRRTNALRAGLGVSVTPLTSIEFAAEATTDRFVYSPERDGDGKLILGGVTLAPQAVIRGNAWVGYRYFSSPTSGAANFSGAVGFGTLVYERSSGGSLALFFQRDLEFSYDKSLAYFLSNAINLTGVVPLSTRWQLQGFAATTSFDYRDAGSGLEGPLQRVNEFGGALGFKVGEATVIGLQAQWANALGSEAWKEVRIVAFLTYGSADGSYQRLDRPIPFSR